MSTQTVMIGRREALQRRIELSQSLVHARDQLQAWHALVTAMGAVVRLNTMSNPTTAQFFKPILVKAINQERAYIATVINLTEEVSVITVKLRRGDVQMTVEEFMNEQAENGGL